jgi:hypothetical protein
MVKEKVPGIRIEFSEEKPGILSLEARFFIEEGVRSKTFVSNAQIRAAIKEYRAKMSLRKETRKFLGRMHLIYEPETKTAIWESYYPFGSIPEQCFVKKGIASLLELIVDLEAKKRFLELKWFKHLCPNFLRQEQLSKRGLGGIKGKERYSYQEAISRLRGKIARDSRSALARRKRKERMQKLRKKLVNPVVRIFRR